MKSPQQRTLQLLRENNYIAEVVEVFIKPPGVRFGWRKDLLGLIDVLAFRDDKFLGAQACAVSGLSAHRKKALASPWLPRILRAGWAFVIYGWYPWPDEDRRDECKAMEAVLNEDGSVRFERL